MIQKTESQTEKPTSARNKPVPSRNTTPPLPSPGQEKRERLYAHSRIFSNELVVVVSDLSIASVEHRDEVFEFLKWFHPERRQSQEIAERIKACSKINHAILRHYVAFAFRFRVWLHGMKAKSGGLKIRPVYEEISGLHLDAELKEGALVPPNDIDDGIVDSNETGDHYEDYRSKLVPKENGDETEPYRLLRLRISEDQNSELLHILNSFYDPLELNFVEIQRQISGRLTQSYLMCMVGELSDATAWRNAGSVRPQMIKRVYGVSTRGRKSNFDQRARDMRLVSEHGLNVKASTNASIVQRGQDPAHVTDKEFRREKERILRATKTHSKLTSRNN